MENSSAVRIGLAVLTSEKLVDVSDYYLIRNEGLVSLGIMMAEYSSYLIQIPWMVLLGDNILYHASLAEG